jgi:hypothetical protein
MVSVWGEAQASNSVAHPVEWWWWWWVLLLERGRMHLPATAAALSMVSAAAAVQIPALLLQLAYAVLTMCALCCC